MISAALQTVPVPMQVVDMGSGEVIETRTANFTLMPAPTGACPECARRHDAGDPHDAASLHYQYSFYGRHGRWPTWTDAVAHCTAEVQEAWLGALREIGVDVDAGALLPPGER